MTVRTILDTKGHQIESVEPDAKLAAAIKILSERKIGAVLVMSDGRIEGILSERDIVRVLGEARAMRDQIAGAVKIEPADLTDTGRDQQIGRVAGKARTGDAVLHDVEGIDHDGGDAWPSAAAEKLALHGALGGKQPAEAAFRRRRLDLGLRCEGDRCLGRWAVRVDRRAVGKDVA